MHRRSLLAAAATLAAPAIAAGRPVLRFIPDADLAVLDPVWTTATVTRDHAYLVFDHLWGFDAGNQVQPQMLAGHTLDAGHTTWTLMLRDGLRFHDGEPVRAADVVPSIQRWAARSPFGQLLLAASDEIRAVDDRTVLIRLKRPFPVSRCLANGPPIMPARLAVTDPGRQVREMVGSGPFRFLADEHMAGARVAYARFDGYRPREDGVPSFTAGPKIAHLDRVEWTVIPDTGTASAAMQSGETDWWGAPSFDMIPRLRRLRTVVIEVLNTQGSVPILRFNHLHPPFDRAAVRRAVLPAIDQASFMQALAGDDRTFWKTGVGVFALESPMASSVGMEVLTGPRDLGAAQRALQAAGYDGTSVVVMSPADLPTVSATSQLAADLLKRIGFAVDLQVMDWGTLIQRRSKEVAPGQGGWNVVTTGLTGSGIMDPAAHIGLRADGRAAWAGWPTSPTLEALRARWLEADTLAAQQAICRDIQAQFWIDLPYVPLGETYQPYAFNRRVTGIPTGFPLFYGVRVA